jgi:hypothetical protein
MINDVDGNKWPNLMQAVIPEFPGATDENHEEKIKPELVFCHLITALTAGTGTCTPVTLQVCSSGICTPHSHTSSLQLQHGAAKRTTLRYITDKLHIIYTLIMLP